MSEYLNAKDIHKFGGENWYIYTYSYPSRYLVSFGFEFALGGGALNVGIHVPYHWINFQFVYNRRKWTWY